MRRARRALVALSLALAMPALAAPAGRVGVVAIAPTREARVELSAAVRAGLGASHVPLADPAVQRALDDVGPEHGDGLAALAEARAARARGEVANARAAADRAVLALAAAQAAGERATDDLVAALAVRLTCADRAGDRAAAIRSATLLAGLGADRAADLDPAVLARYPALDAIGNVATIELAIERPAAAAIFVDGVRIGEAPVKAYLPEGEHLIAAGAGERGVARFVEVGWPPPVVELRLPPFDPSLGARAFAQAFRHGAPGSRSLDLGRALAAAGLDRAVVARARDDLEVWVAGADGARRLGAARTIGEAVALLHAPRRLEVSADPPRLARSPDEGDHPWWAYASLAAAVAIAGGVVVAGELGDDRQRIRIEF